MGQKSEPKSSFQLISWEENKIKCFKTRPKVKEHLLIGVEKPTRGENKLPSLPSIHHTLNKNFRKCFPFSRFLMVFLTLHIQSTKPNNF